MGIFDDIADVAGDVVDAAGDVASDLVDAGSDLFGGAGQLVGVAVAGGALFVIGPAAVIPAFLGGAAAANALIRHRPIADAERAFAERVYGPTLPPDIVLTNLTGIEGRKFTCPNLSGQVLLNLGDAYDDPMGYQDGSYPAPGKVFIHELGHAWQIHHATFVPGLVCEGIGNQLADASYLPGDRGGPWSGYNLEQQATIVDEWFAPGNRGPRGFKAMHPEHPFFPYICVDVRGGQLPRESAMVSSSAAVARTFDHLDVFWPAPDGSIGSNWWDSNPGAGWGDHGQFQAAGSGNAQASGALTAVSRRPEHLDVYWVTPQGAVGSTWWNRAPGLGWGDHGPFLIAGPGAARVESPVSAVGRLWEHLDVFWIGPDGAIGTTWWDAAPGCGWGDHAPFPITPPGAAQSAGLAAVSRYPDHLDVFWIGPDGGVGSTWWNAAAGSGWGDHAPFPIASSGAARSGSPVSAVARTPDHLDVFWIGPDGAIGSTWWDAAPGSNWGDHAPFPITPPGAAQPSGLAAVARQPGHLDVFWVGPDGAVGSTWWDGAPGCGWGDHAPFPITPPGAARAGSPVSAVARTPDHLDVFWVGLDGAIGTTWWDGAPGCGWGDHAPFPISAPGSA